MSMSLLPVIQAPVYDLVLPSNGKKIQYRPFLVKEKKLFLLVKEAKEINAIVTTIKQIIKNCIIFPSDVDVDDLPIMDIEYLFVNLRAKSSGEIIDVEVECQNEVDGKPCKQTSKLHFNLTQMEFEKTDGHTNTIQLTDNFGVVMKYPTFHMAELLQNEIKNPQNAMNIMADSIETIYTKDSVFKAKDFKREEIISWFEEMTEDMFNKIEFFFDSSPKLVGKTQFKCNKCGYEETIKLQGIQDFFG